MKMIKTRFAISVDRNDSILILSMRVLLFILRIIIKLSTTFSTFSISVDANLEIRASLRNIFRTREGEW